MSGNWRRIYGALKEIDRPTPDEDETNIHHLETRSTLISCIIILGRCAVVPLTSTLV